MADESPPPPGAAGQGERRRPGPTIDLKATEIKSDQPDAAAAALRERAAPAPSPHDTPDADGTGEAKPDPRMPPRSAVHSALAGFLARVSWPLVGAGVAGALVTLAIVWLLLIATDRSADLNATDARLAKLQQQVAALAGQDSTNAKSQTELASRLQKLETEAGALRAPASDPVLATRLAAAEARLKSLADAADALSERTDSTAAANKAALGDLNDKLARATAAPAEAAGEAASANADAIAALSKRADALEAAAKKLEGTLDAKLSAALAAQSTEKSDEQALRTDVAALALSAAVERGAPFTAELAAAQAQAPDKSKLAPLAPFAAAGIGDAAALAHEIAELEPAMLQAAGTPSEGSFLEKLEAHAQRLVRITRVGEATGDDPASVVARLDAKAARGDLAGALAELGKLPPPARAPAQAWSEKVQAREAALAASRGFAADALSALAKP